MADRSIAIRLSANVQGLVAGLNTGKKALQDFGTKGLDAVGRNEQHINTLTNQVGALGLALTGLAVLAVKRFADFDQAMSNVAATGDDARGSIEALREAAIDAGARTVFSASEAAGAIEELAKAGVSAADILNGGLDGALDLAAAGGIEVAEAAGIASVALKQFGLRGEDVTHVADLLAAGAGKAMGGVDDLGMALKQGGLVASQTGLTIEETTAALSAFASAGLLGSDAGTSLKTMLQRLTPQSAEAQRQFDELGISAYDAQGNFVGLEAFAGQLQTRMKDLTPEARNAALSVMFGSDAVRAASVLYDEGARGIAEWTAAVDDQGYAAETAATRLDNLNGDLEQFAGSLETAFIQAGSGGNDMLRGLVQGATDVVNAFGDLPGPVQQTALLLVGGAGLVALGVAGLGKLVIGINDARTALSAMGVTAKATRLAVAGVGAALGIAAVGITSWISAQAEARQKVEALAETLDSLSGALTDNSDEWIANALAQEQSFGLFGLGRMKSMVEVADEMGVSVETLTAAYQGNEAAINEAKAAAEEYEAANGWSVQAEAQSQRFIKNLDDQVVRLDEARQATDDKRRADEAAGVEQGEVAGAYETTTSAFEAQAKALEELFDAQQKLAGIVLSEREAQRALQEAIDGVTASVDENGKTLDITTEAGRNNQAALDAVASSSWDLIDSMRENGATQEELQATMGTSRQAFLDAATAAGMGADEANRLADELGLIPEAVASTVTITPVWNQAAFDAAYSAWAAQPRNINVGLTTKSGPPKAWASGGYTGDGGKFQPAGVVHRGEFVMDKERTAMWRPWLEAMHQDRPLPRFYTGGFVDAPAASSSAPGGGAGLQIGTVNAYGYDPSSAVREFGRELDWQMAKGGAK